MRALTSLLICAIVSPLSAVDFTKNSVALTYERQQLDLDGGASIDSDAYQVSLRKPLLVSRQNIVTLSGFHETTVFDGELDQLSENRLSLFSLNRLSRQWSVVSVTNLIQASAEGADLGGSVKFSGIYAAGYSKSRDLTMGFGLGLANQFDDSFSIFPVVLLDWKFAEDWKLTTYPTPGTRFGPGLSVKYDEYEYWSLYAGVRYLSREYRLENDGRYEFSTSRLFGTLEYELEEDMILSTTVGYNFGGEIENDGEEISLDPAPFVGLDLTWRF